MFLGVIVPFFRNTNVLSEAKKLLQDVQVLSQICLDLLNYFNGWQLAKMKKSIPDMSLP